MKQTNDIARESNGSNQVPKVAEHTKTSRKRTPPRGKPRVAFMCISFNWTILTTVSNTGEYEQPYYGYEEYEQNAEEGGFEGDYDPNQL